jgi:hypothetical protein
MAVGDGLVSGPTPLAVGLASPLADGLAEAVAEGLGDGLPLAVG